MSGNKQRNRRSKILLLIEIILILVALYVGFMLFIYSKMQTTKMKNNEFHINEMDTSDMSGYKNIALFGVDSRDNDLKSNTRSDSIIIASINKWTRKIKLVSIYRDTLVYIPDHGYTKINHAYAYGGPKLAVDTINYNFDMNITDFVTVNFSALTDMVDALGGVEIEITPEEVDYVNRYAKDVANINGKEFTKIKAGKNILSGVAATGYSRVRYTAGGDFTRAERQRRVVKAIISKAKHSNPVKLYKAADSALPQVYTSLDAIEFVQLASFFPFYSLKDENMKGYPFDKKDGKVNGAYVVIPKTPSSNVTQLHEFLFGTNDYTPSKTVKTLDSEI